jgi:hypothetical protein
MASLPRSAVSFANQIMFSANPFEILDRVNSDEADGTCVPIHKKMSNNNLRNNKHCAGTALNMRKEFTTKALSNKNM